MKMIVMDLFTAMMSPLKVNLRIQLQRLQLKYVKKNHSADQIIGDKDNVVQTRSCLDKANE